MREKGFALVELLVAIGIVALVAGGGSAATFQITRVSRQNNDVTTAIRQAQNVGYALSNDALAAMEITVSPKNDGASFITMFWTDWETGELHETEYVWLSSSNSLHRIERESAVHALDGGQSTSTTLIADNIEDVDCNLQADGTWEIIVTARSGNKSATRRYQILPRISAQS